MGRALVFDACQVGVVLRAVLFVEVVLGVCALFGTTGPGDWLARLALLTGAALPATLLWLVTACSLKKALQRLQPALQYAAGVLLGMLAGLYACAMLLLAGAAGEAPPWLACAASGALLSALLVTALQLRARSRGFELPDETVAFLQRRFPRDMGQLAVILDELDAASLAEQRRVTVPFIRQVLGISD